MAVPEPALAIAGDPAPAPPVVVALVCSAGGLEALRCILGALPREFPGAVLVLQHQAPLRRSYLVDVLGRSSGLPVRQARSGDRLTAGTVLVVPPGRHAVVTAANTVALVASNQTPPYRPSADLLLTSLALTAAERTIAVVLSGFGHDAATGASVLHACGGTVIASDEASSEHFEMPRASIEREDAVDHVLPVEDIAPMLVKLAAAR